MKSFLLSLVLAIASPAAAQVAPQQPTNARPQELGVNTTCPAVMVLAARETTAPPGFGSAMTLVNLILQAFPGTSAAQSIEYPAAGGNNQQYAQSVTAGISAVLTQLAVFTAQCPNSKIVMHGYSQGAQIMDDAFCGGPDGSSLTTNNATLVPAATGQKVAALVFMGDPRHIGGEVFNRGNATAGGFAARPVGFSCPLYEARMVSFCDSPDPFCSNGTDMATHQGYGREYGQQALQFVMSRLNASTAISSNTSAPVFRYL
ncbi:hypothetical protein N0V93_004711 [Gnomoniopsis smithogilvyi]|uniref:Cutinase n=1 Tax=Gnomoniopsis smithogilvyi TaxID=1191159 RepID=A0A9W8YT35_9PEZI|nr:hypothetical protein N0V93_004711 [Gnomoniopsis smithogilvyi]